VALGGGLYSDVADLGKIAINVAEIRWAGWGVFVPDDGESCASKIHSGNTQADSNLREVTTRMTRFGAVILPLHYIEIGFLLPGNPLVPVRI
jgi:hypothetical protein